MMNLFLEFQISVTNLCLLLRKRIKKKENKDIRKNGFKKIDFDPTSLNLLNRYHLLNISQQKNNLKSEDISNSPQKI